MLNVRYWYFAEFKTKICYSCDEFIEIIFISLEQINETNNLNSSTLYR